MAAVLAAAQAREAAAAARARRSSPPPLTCCRQVRAPRFNQSRALPSRPHRPPPPRLPQHATQRDGEAEVRFVTAINSQSRARCLLTPPDPIPIDPVIPSRYLLRHSDPIQQTLPNPIPMPSRSDPDPIPITPHSGQVIVPQPALACDGRGLPHAAGGGRGLPSAASWRWPAISSLRQAEQVCASRCALCRSNTWSWR